MRVSYGSHALLTELAGHVGFGVLVFFYIIIALPSTSDRWDAWEEWVDNFDQTRAQLLFQLESRRARCDRRALVFIFRDHNVHDKLCRDISWIKKTFLYAHVKCYIEQRNEDKLENYSRMVSIFLLREYLL